MRRCPARCFEQLGGVTATEQAVGPGDTIAAISTAAGEGAIALIRLSGEDAITVADRVFRGKRKPSGLDSHVQFLGEIVDAERVIDQVMIAVHRMPASYTGEDVVEISCHGGMLVSARVLQACLRNGARAARPGEFTERAFVNGKMDLTQAEAVMDLIRARSDLALRSATEQLEGRLGAEINAIREQLTQLLAHVEASIDFPEEGIAPDEGEPLRARMQAVQNRITQLVRTSEHGRILRDGLRIVIYGATNVGKSSLLNRLLGFDRAIVSEIPGTTRDTIEEVISLRGVPVRLLDTAGVRGSEDALEQAGMARTARSLATADLVLHVVDRSLQKPENFNGIKMELPQILLLNKSDLPEHFDWRGTEALRISCLQNAGLCDLEERIIDTIGQEHFRAENSVAINSRHRDCLRRALEACERAGATMDEGMSAEYMAIDLRAAHRAVTEVVGGENAEEILDSIFSQFCIGK